MSGYTRRTDVTNPSVTYGSWSGWTDSVLYKSSTLDVDTQQVVATPAKKTYTYSGYYSPNCPQASGGKQYTHYCLTCGKALGGDWYYQETTLDYQLTPVSGWGPQSCKHCGKVTTKFKTSGNMTYYWEKVNEIPATYKTQYRSRTITTTYYFEKKVYSDWSFNVISGSNVETRKVYQYGDDVYN